MTVSESQGRKFTVNEHVKNAWRRAGLIAVGQVPTNDELSEGREHLQYVINELESEGFPARNTGWIFVPMVEDTFKYTMPDGVQDLLNPAMYIDQDQKDPERSDSETQIKLITEQEYIRLSAKSAKGRPYLVYPDRGADQLIAYLWPIPDATGANVRFRVARNYFNVDDGDATLDLRRFWDGFILDALAARIAQRSSLLKVAMILQASAITKLKRCKGQARERPGTQAFVTHKGGHYA